MVIDVNKNRSPGLQEISRKPFSTTLMCILVWKIGIRGCTYYQGGRFKMLQPARILLAWTEKWGSYCMVLQLYGSAVGSLMDSQTFTCSTLCLQYETVK